MNPFFSIPAALIALAFVSPAAGAPARSIARDLTADQRQQQEREARLIVDILQNHHYSGRAFREIPNETMITRFAEELDPGRQFLTQADIDFITRRFGRTFKSVYLYKGNLQPAFEIYDLFVERVESRRVWLEDRLEGSFDLSAAETVPTQRERPRNRAEADEQWERMLKEAVLVERLFGQTPPDANEAVARSYRSFYHRLAALDAGAVRERFLDAVIRSFDPHSGYLSADSTRDFTIEMGDSLAGIGVEFRKVDGQFVITGVHPGGPADLAGTVEIGDLLEAFAEGDSAPLDIRSRTLNEIVTLVRGEAGTRLRLYHRRPDEPEARETPLTREVVALPDRRARGAIAEVPDPDGVLRKIGWIDLPAFYGGGIDDDRESAIRDVAELIQQMQAEGLEGLVLDLRRNPGGALPEAVALSGLFLPEGSRVMYARGLSGEMEDHTVGAGPERYEGPLMLLISSQSASASEILAGTLQLHRRAVIIGATATFGKGTVQSYIDLTQIPGAGASPDWGTLKVTAQHYYLANGGAVQATGIPADLVLPVERENEMIREADLPGSLAPETLASAAAFTPAVLTGASVSDDLLGHLRETLAQHLGEYPEWALWEEENELFDEGDGATERSLNLKARSGTASEAETRFAAVLNKRSELGAELAFDAHRIDTAQVRRALESHRESLRKRVDDNGQEQGLIWAGEWFAVRDPEGVWHDRRLSDLEYRRYFGHAETLAAAIRGSTGQPSGADVRLLLHQLSAIGRSDERSYREILLNHLGPVDDEALKARVTSFLGQLIQIDADGTQDLPRLDIPLRESLRMSAAWAVGLVLSRSPES